MAWFGLARDNDETVFADGQPYTNRRPRTMLRNIPTTAD
jgi:hypothetical protein